MKINELTQINSNKLKPIGKVLLVISCYFPYIGGDENISKAVAETLILDGFKFTVITKKMDNSLKYYEVINSVPVYRVPCDVIGIFIKTLLEIRKFDSILFIGALGGNSKTKVLIQALLGFVIKKVFKKKVLLRLGSSKEVYKDNLFKPFFTKLFLKSFDKFLPVNKGLIKFLIDDIGISENKIEKPPFKFINTEIFKPLQNVDKLKNKYNLPKNKKILLFLGRVSLEKNIETLIKAFNLLDDTYYLVLAVAIQSKEKQEYFDDLKSSITNKNFKVIINENNPVELINVSDVVVMPSIKEGKGAVQFEAMACGKVCICSNIPNITESLPEELLNLTFNPNNVDDLIEKIKSFFKNTQAIDNNKLVKFVNDSYSQKVIMDKYKILLKTKNINKIVFQVPTYLPCIGGIQSAVNRLGTGFIKNGIKVTVITKKSDKSLKSNEILNDINIKRVNDNFIGTVLEPFVVTKESINSNCYFYMGNIKHFSFVQYFTLAILKLLNKPTYLIMSSIDEGESKGVI